MHKSVLLEESINLLNIKENGVYVDATLGYGGHSVEILKRVKRGFLFAFDQDDEAISLATSRLQKVSDNFLIIHTNFVNMQEKLKENNIEKVDGILFDLGVSSMQLDEDDRGFSYHHDALLDMRMNREQKISAYDIVNNYDENKLFQVIRDYGEEKYAYSIAKNIVKYRQTKKIETTLELVDIIKNSMPMKAMRDAHPARKTFQAIRIEVNNELDVLEKTLIQALELLNINGRICVITFHSLEDRIVKNIFKKYTEVDLDLPFLPDSYIPKYKIIEKGIVPSKEELQINKRARSARLRVIERIRD